MFELRTWIAIRLRIAVSVCVALLVVAVRPLPIRADQPAPSGQNAALAGDAFANATGIVSVNEAAGSGNRQANAVAIGATIASDQTLARSSSRSSARAAVSSAIPRRVTLSPGAFASSSGIVQTNQVAGDGNASFNAFAVHVSP